jgi:hypothetical protein
LGEEFGQPDENRLERGRPQLAHPLAQVLFSWRRRGFVDGLKNLSHDTGVAESAHESIEPFLLILLERLVPPYNESRFLQERGDGLEIAGAEHVRQVGLERGEHVSAGPVLLALLEDVEQDRNDVGPQILLILLGDRVADPPDLGFVQPVQRRVEVLDRHDRALGRLLGDLAFGLFRTRRSCLGAAPPPPSRSCHRRTRRSGTVPAGIREPRAASGDRLRIVGQRARLLTISRNLMISSSSTREEGEDPHPVLEEVEGEASFLAGW